MGPYFSACSVQTLCMSRLPSRCISPSTELHSGPGTSFNALDLLYTLWPKLQSQVSYSMETSNGSECCLSQGQLSRVLPVRHQQHWDVNMHQELM